MLHFILQPSCDCARCLCLDRICFLLEFHINRSTAPFSPASANMVSSLPIVAQHVSCQIAHVHNQRVLHPFKSLATASKQYQRPCFPALTRRQGEVLPGPSPSRKSTVTGSIPDALCSAAQRAIFASAGSGARGGVHCRCSLHVEACRLHKLSCVVVGF